ncbi:hypothetical protein [Bacillus thuringiensis]|uniref:hypothetical protein n=1 Tax=Bacillus thuringiensis TaxID=1428 RepID=UPI003F5C6D79
MNKEQKIEVIKRMLRELGSEHDVGGFNEYDQEITSLFEEVLSYLSHEGLNFTMDFIEKASTVGVNRKKQMTSKDMKQWAIDNNRRKGLNV